MSELRADELTVKAPPSPPAWGSDAMAAVLASLEIPYLSLTPGASYRGLHDSIVNYLGNAGPQMLVCLHEEHAVAVAHGYAKVTGRPMAVALHGNVGLMHGIMAIFNAWCARVPMLIIGATGPLDAAQRRPWIDWIHTAGDQGALIRNFSKWDDQPGSIQATLDSLVRAYAVSATYPEAPTYVCIDSALQEAPLVDDVVLPDPQRHQPVPVQAPADAVVADLHERLARAQRPLILIGRVGRSEEAWRNRVEIAERYDARVIADLRVGSVFPTGHRLQPLAPQGFLSPSAKELIRRSDLILALDWVDLAGALQAYWKDPVTAEVVSCTLDFTLHNGWSKDHFAQPTVDLAIATHPDLLVAALANTDRAVAHGPTWAGDPIRLDDPPLPGPDGGISLNFLARTLREALGDAKACLSTVPLGWTGADLELLHPLDYLGGDSGGGVGYGPGATVGVALGLLGSERMAIGILGDGDFLMGSSALWTAAHYRLPLLVIVANNRSFFNDEVHQHRVAMQRDRPTENRWIGQHIRDPDPDLAALARSYGLIGYGPIERPEELGAVLSRAVADVTAGEAVVVDVSVGTQGCPGQDAPVRQR